MKTNVHAVFQADFRDIMYAEFGKNEDFNLVGFDSDFKTYSYFILNEGTIEYAKNVLVMVNEDNVIPLIDTVNEIAEIATRIKLTRQDIRLIMVFPLQVRDNADFSTPIQKLIMTGIYDLHFRETFGFEDILRWLKNAKSINDIRSFITSSEINQIQSTLVTEEATEIKENSLISEPTNVEDSQVQQATEHVSVETDIHTEPIAPEIPQIDNQSSEIEKVATSIQTEMTTDVEGFGNQETQKNKGNRLFKNLFHRARKVEESVDSTNPTPQKKMTPEEKEAQLEKMVISAGFTSGTKKVGIIGLTKNVGTTFITTNFASFLSRNGIETGVYENPIAMPHRTYLSDIFLMFDEEKPNESLPHAIINKADFDKKDIYQVNNTYYYPTNYLKSPILEFQTHNMIRYVNTGNHLIKLVDMGCVSEKDFADGELINNLSTFDCVVFVVSPLPYKFLPNLDLFMKTHELLEKNDIPYITVLNEFNGEIPKSDLKLLHLHENLHFPSVEHAAILKAMCKRNTVYDYDSDVQEGLEPYFVKLAQHLGLPLEFKSNKKSKIFLKIAK